MKKFTWEHFDTQFIKKIVYNEKTERDFRPDYQTDDIDMLMPSMLSIAEVPTRDFVIKYRTEIEFDFLKYNPSLALGITGAPKSANPYTELNYLSQEALTNSLIDQYIRALYQIGGGEFAADEYSEFSSKRTVDLKLSLLKEISLYDFQQEAVNELKKHFIEQENQAGLLVMPTGSGKTRTAAAFLLQEMIPQGYQIVWLTHRHMLIDQTAAVFYNNSPAIKKYDQKKKHFQMVCVSGNHQTIKATEKEDDLMILSVQSTCRSLDYLTSVLGRKVIIVVDEAHHTVAKSYRKTIDQIMRKRKDVKLLGLTATPVRSIESEINNLYRLFGNKIIYNISMANLIKHGILAEPVFEHIQTGENFEAIISLDEKQYIKRWKELPASLVERVAKSSERNGLIVRQYLDNQDKYGKTIIFALNGYHAFTLSEEFRKHNIKCDFVYSLHGKEDNSSVIRKFRNNELDVLININILTEGSDIPEIQTVFLTRPTSSDVLLMQMIGRGMRGIHAGGTKLAYIVDFCDKWETFNKWLDPQWLINNQYDYDNPIPDTSKQRKDIELIPWGMVKDIYDSITYSGGRLNARVSIPYGWYSLLDDTEDVPLIVFKDQYSCYESIFADRKILAKGGKPPANALRKLYFDKFVTLPGDQELMLFWDNIKNGQSKPDFFLFEDRDSVDPHVIAEKIKSERLYPFDYIKDVFDQYPMAQELFGTVQKYTETIISIINYSLTPPRVDEVVEVPVELLPYSIDDFHDLKLLTQEVIDEMFAGYFEGLENIEWTLKPVSRYYGMCHWFNGKIKVKMNLLLNSSQVDREVIKYVIYHELLHRDNQYHDAAFRAEEHKYPNYTELERFLDYKIYGHKVEM